MYRRQRGWFLAISAAAWLVVSGSALGIHNSLFIREMLREANKDPVRIEEARVLTVGCAAIRRPPPSPANSRWRPVAPSDGDAGG